MNVQNINPFLEASANVLKEFGITFKTGKLQLVQEPQLKGKISVFIGVTGVLRGQVLFNMEDTTAHKIASAMMMGMPVTTLDDLAKSAISELFNMVLGHTATIFYNNATMVDITPPTLMMGEHVILSATKEKMICVPLELSVGGNLDINIYLSEKEDS